MSNDATLSDASALSLSASGACRSSAAELGKRAADGEGAEWRRCPELARTGLAAERAQTSRALETLLSHLPSNCDSGVTERTFGATQG